VVFSLPQVQEVFDKIEELRQRPEGKEVYKRACMLLC